MSPPEPRVPPSAVVFDVYVCTSNSCNISRLKAGYCNNIYAAYAQQSISNVAFLKSAFKVRTFTQI